jgi:hypothetical protein
MKRRLKRQKSVKFLLKMTENEKKLLKAIAGMEGLTQSDLLRMCFGWHVHATYPELHKKYLVRLEDVPADIFQQPPATRIDK